MYESKSLVYGDFPTFTCRRGVGEGAASRLAYTWIALLVFSYLFTLFFFYMYQIIGRSGARGAFSVFVNETEHFLETRTMSWILIVFVPLICILVFDVSAKVFSNLWYPTQSQIHLEIESLQKTEEKRKKQE